MLNILLFKHCTKDEPNLKAVRDEQRYIVKNAKNCDLVLTFIESNQIMK
jgi:hypothetical protein